MVGYLPRKYIENHNQAVQTTYTRMAQAAQRVGRSVKQITLVAVSKQKPIEEVRLLSKLLKISHLPKVDAYGVELRKTHHLF